MKSKTYVTAALSQTKQGNGTGNRRKIMSPAGNWKLHIGSSKVSPPTDSFSSHDSLDHALAAAFLLPAHEEAVRIEGPNGEMYDQPYINAERARWHRQAW